MTIATIRARSVTAHDRLDAHFFTAPGVAVGEMLAMLEATGTDTVRLGDIARVWDPPRFARAWAAPAEPGIAYLRPYEVFDFLPATNDRLSLHRNDGVEALRPSPGTLLQTCSGRNLGPCTFADSYIAQFALSHDMIRIEIADPRMRGYVLAFMRTPTGQALLRRGKSGSVIDHLTTADVAALPVPLLPDDIRDLIANQIDRSVAAAAQGREEIAQLLDAQDKAFPMPDIPAGLKDGWTLRATSAGGRLDAAYHHPLIVEARTQLVAAGGTRCGDSATASLPVRYKRYYVSSDHGRPILSGRQILQLEPVNLRYVSDRSFREPDKYVIRSGMTIFGADGRAEGSQGAAALVTPDRSGWLASNHVMRLTPHPRVRPGALWLAISSRQVRAQINSLSFGSVVDQTNPDDVEEIILPPVGAPAAERAESAWKLLSDAGKTARDATSLLEAQLIARSERSSHLHERIM